MTHKVRSTITDTSVCMIKLPFYFRRLGWKTDQLQRYYRKFYCSTLIDADPDKYEFISFVVTDGQFEGLKISVPATSLKMVKI